jgi:hypothetical protein
MYANETSIGSHWRSLPLYGEGIVDINTVPCLVRKSRYSGGNLVLNDRPHSGRPVSTTHNLNGQKFKGFIRTNQRTSQRAIAKNLSTSLATIN